MKKYLFAVLLLLATLSESHLALGMDNNNEEFQDDFPVLVRPTFVPRSPELRRPIRNDRDEQRQIQRDEAVSHIHLSTRNLRNDITEYRGREERVFNEFQRRLDALRNRAEGLESMASGRLEELQNLINTAREQGEESSYDNE